MAKAPNTTVVLYKGTALTPTAQRKFASQSARSSWFSARASRSFTGLSHVRHTTGTVSIEAEVGEVLEHDYLSIDNKAYGGLFYCYLLDAEYVNDNNTKITFMIDAWQTYQFDVSFLPCEIDRQGLTESDYTAAWADKYRAAMIEMTSTEDLPVTEDLELVLKKDQGYVTPAGKLRTSPSDASLVPDGAYSATAPLAIQFGTQPAPSTSPRTQVWGGDYVFEMIWSQDLQERINTFLASWSASDGVKCWADYASAGGNMVRNTFLVTIGQDPATASLYTPTKMMQTMKMFMEVLQTSPDLTDQIISSVIVPTDFMGGLVNTAASPSTLNNATQNEVVVAESVPYATIYGTEVHNPKLYRAPFRLLRVRKPDGTESFYQFERSQMSKNGNAAISLAVYKLFDNYPSTVVVPLGYAGYSANVGRGLEYSNYPQLTYATSKYGAYLTQKYQQAILADTPGSKTLRESGWGAVGDVASIVGNTGLSAGQGALAGLANPAAALPGAALGAVSSIPSTISAVADFGTERSIADAAYRTAGGGRGSVPEALAMHEDAFGGQNYNAGSNSGTIGIRLNAAQWVAEVVTLRSEVLSVFDRYLSNFGYKSGRVGTPNIMTASPHYSPVGDGSGLTTHYCKTNGARVYGVPAVYARDIETMFDGGVNFYNG